MASPDDRVTCPYLTICSLRLFTEVWLSVPHWLCDLCTRYRGVCGNILTAMLLLVGCWTTKEHASVSQRLIPSDNCTCCHTETEAADPEMPGARQGSHRKEKKNNVEVTAMTGPGQKPYEESRVQGQGPYAPQGSTSLLPKLSVTSKVSARTSHAWVGSRVHFRSSEDVTLLEFTSPIDRE